MMNRIIISLVLILSYLPCNAQKEFSEPLNTMDYIHDDLVKTAVLEASYSAYQSIENKVQLDMGNPNLNLMPVFPLNAGRVKLSFDDFDENERDFGYTIMFCNADWTLSNLNSSEYIDGFSEDLIQNIDFSYSTKATYRHFEIDFPNQTMKPIIAGNYLFVVFDEDTEEPILVKRFAIYEPNESIATGSVSFGKSPNNRFTHQELSINVRTSDLKNYYLPEEITVTAQQNGRWDNALVDLAYSRMDNSAIYYERLNTNVFEAGSENRVIDIRSLLTRGEGVENVQYSEEKFVANLFPAKPKKKTFYINQVDINGGFIVNRYLSRNSETEADYAEVEFYLESPTGPLNGDVFIMGELNDWNLDDRVKMEFRPEENIYRKTLYLKQGYYNYSYVFRANTKNAIASFEPFEGNYSQTTNQYRVYVYQRNNGIPTYDRLVDVLTFDFNR